MKIINIIDKIKQIQYLYPKKGDIIVITINDGETCEFANTIEKEVANILKRNNYDNDVLIIQESAIIKIIAKEESYKL